MAALTLTVDAYRDKLLGGWMGKSAGLTLGQSLRGQFIPGRSNFYNPVPGQPVPSAALDFPLVWLDALKQHGPDTTPEDLAVAWLEHLDYSEEEFGYAVLNLRRGLPPPASGAYSNFFRNGTRGVSRADLWGMLCPGAPQVAAAYAYHDSTLDHSEEGEWAAMYVAALCSAAFFITDPMTLITIGLAMIPKTCRTARAVKTAIVAAQRAANWLEARENILHEVGTKNFSDAPHNVGFLTIGLFYGLGDFGASLAAGVNCGYDSEAVGSALGALLGIRAGHANLPQEWLRPIGDILISGMGLRDFEAPRSLSEAAEQTLTMGRMIVAARCPDVAIVEKAEAESIPNMEPLPPVYPTSNIEIDDAPSAATTAEDTGSIQNEASSNLEIDDTLTITAPVRDVMDVIAPPVSAFARTADDVEAIQNPKPKIQNVYTPQSVSEAEPPPITPGIADGQAASPLYAGPVQQDPVSAIAWADNTLVKPLLVTPPMAQIGQAGTFRVVLDCGDSPCVAHNEMKTLGFYVSNRGGSAFSGRVVLLAPSGWQISGPPNTGQRQYIAAETGTYRTEFTLRVPEGAARIDIANAITLRFLPEEGPSFDAEFILMGASCWRIVGPFANFDGEGFDRAYLPEDRPGLNETYVNRLFQSVTWEKRTFLEAALDLETAFKNSSGVVYGQTILRSPTGRNARLVANTNSGVKVWLNNTLVLRRNQRENFRPNLGSGLWAAEVALHPGDNPVMVKWVRGSEPFQFSLTVSDLHGRGLPEVGNTSW